jgi:hypothetical protein
MSSDEADACGVEDGCVTVIRSPSEFRSLTAVGAAATTLHCDERGRVRSSGRLVILSVTANRSLACGLIREAARRTCARHRHETTFLELPIDAFPGASDIARGQLRVSRLPTVISFRHGLRLDHIHGREAKSDDTFGDFVQRNL